MNIRYPIYEGVYRILTKQFGQVVVRTSGKHQTDYRKRWNMGKTGYAVPFGATPIFPA